MEVRNCLLIIAIYINMNSDLCWKIIDSDIFCLEIEIRQTPSDHDTVEHDLVSAWSYIRDLFQCIGSIAVYIGT